MSLADRTSCKQQGPGPVTTDRLTPATSTPVTVTRTTTRPQRNRTFP
jgi:hypothetical protein